MLQSNVPGMIKFTSLRTKDIEPYSIRDKDGNILHVFDAALIRLLAEGLRSGYEVLVPPDNAIGTRQPDGNWTGMMGMVKRSEADVAMVGVSMTEERLGAVNFSYPHLQSEVSFMTDEPQPQSIKSAIFKPFAIEIWAVLLVISIAVSFLFHILIKRKDYQAVMLDILGSLLQQSMCFEIRTPAVRLITISWLLGIFVITNSYKAVLLSFLSIPTMSGIRDISELHEASLQYSFKCFVFKGSYLTKTFSESSDESTKAIGECLRRTEIAVESTTETFSNTPSEKALLGVKLYMRRYARNYFMSDDFFYEDLLGLPMSKGFRFEKELNRLIHRIVAAGLVDKIKRDEYFYDQLVMPTLQSDQTDTSSDKISLEDISGAIYILVAGWLFALITLFAEIFIGKLLPKRK